MVAVHFNAPTSLFIVAGGAAVKTQSLCFFFSLSPGHFITTRRGGSFAGGIQNSDGETQFFFSRA